MRKNPMLSKREIAQIITTLEYVGQECSDRDGDLGKAILLNDVINILGGYEEPAEPWEECLG
jgi:hypothetical protein